MLTRRPERGLVRGGARSTPSFVEIDTHDEFEGLRFVNDHSVHHTCLRSDLPTVRWACYISCFGNEQGVPRRAERERRCETDWALRRVVRCCAPSTANKSSVCTQTLASEGCTEISLEQLLKGRVTSNELLYESCFHRPAVLICS